MKKFVLVLCSVWIIPIVMVYGYSFMDPNFEIGTGSQNLQKHYMGKEVLMEMNGLYKSMDVEEYVVGVLAGTIPSDYDETMLQVQAILIRTNVLKEMQENNTEDAADLSYHYFTVEERQELWGKNNYKKIEAKYESAVSDTAGKVLKAENSLIMALYHEVSIGKTASAKEILGEDISYLQSVDSCQDVEAKHYMNLVSYSQQEVRELLKIENKEESVSVNVEESTENGFVKKLAAGNNSYTGEEAMELFELPSTNFYVEAIDDGIRFVCLGKGHCMGLSQYGANKMALDGKTVEEILAYYYKGVSIVNEK